MIGHNAIQVAGTESVVQRPYYVRVVARADEQLLDSSKDPFTEEALVIRKFDFSIIHRPRTDWKYVEGKDFIVVCVRDGHGGTKSRYKDWDEFCKTAEKDPIVGFVKKWSTISEDYFDMAKANSGAEISFSLDWTRYNAHLRELWKEKYGEYPSKDERLLSYKTYSEASAEAYAEYRKALYDSNNERLKQRDKKRRAEARAMKTAAAGGTNT